MVGSNQMTFNKSTNISKIPSSVNMKEKKLLHIALYRSHSSTSTGTFKIFPIISIIQFMDENNSKCKHTEIQKYFCTMSDRSATDSIEMNMSFS